MTSKDHKKISKNDFEKFSNSETYCKPHGCATRKNLMNIFKV